MQRLEHVVESQQFNPDLLEAIFDEVDFMRQVVKRGTRLNEHAGKVMACLFYEPSTRTRFSFEAAMHRLGGRVMSTENAEAFSSAKKGESLRDTIRIMGMYADVIVLRHKEEGSSKEAATYSQKPIINAGDGKGQHPTQALLDLYTIKKHQGRLEGLKVAMVGDLKYGRTVHSLTYLLSKYEGNELFFVSPEYCQMDPEITDWLSTKGVTFVETDNLDEVLDKVDCLYMTRVQEERFESADDKKAFLNTKDNFVLSQKKVRKMKGQAMIMHPLPRRQELPEGIDENPRAVYFDQAENGLYVRMALLSHVLGKD